MTALRAIEVLVIDCQASGATPAHGDLLAMGWAFCGLQTLTRVREHWIVPRTARPVARAVRELTGWSEARLEHALEDRAVWEGLRAELAARGAAAATPTVIHFARFELAYLRELQARVEPEHAFPLDVCCLHAIAERIYPDLPRRNIRALSGFLGHSTDLTRHVGGHVEASAHIWRTLVPELEGRGVGTWSELQAWLAHSPRPVRRSPKRVYPLSVERRRQLPDSPGVYRFVRSNDSVLYVGKAASLKKRIAGHFKSSGPGTERGLELLTQVHDVRFEQTASVLEAALLEVDEIKRLDPPYNVQLRGAERYAWFASRDFREACSAPDAMHMLGPLPSQNALLGLAGWQTLLDELDSGAAVLNDGLRAWLLAVPVAFLPDDALFREGLAECVRELFAGRALPRGQRVQRAARALWLERGRTERESGSEDSAPDQWDLARVRRRLERTLVNGGLLLRRARLLRLLSHCTVAYQERGMLHARALVIERAQIVERFALATPAALRELPARAGLSAAERVACFDAAGYDRLRVLSTELRRVEQDEGQLALCLGRRHFQHAAVLGLLRGV